jgi:hypothetical protein
MSENNGESLATEEVVMPPAEAAVLSQEAENTVDDRDYETEAREMGWVPEEEWKGDKKPAKFYDAKEFVERGETVIPILRSRLDKEKKEYVERFERLEKMTQKTVKRLQEEHKRELADVKAQMRTAAAKGDAATYDKLEKKFDALSEQDPTKEEGEDAVAVYTKTVDTWRADNTWYDDDEIMAAYADRVSQKMAKDDPKISLEDNLRRTASEVRKKFPEKFGTQRGANGHAPVDGGGALPGGRTKEDPLVAKLPPEAKRQAEADIKAGLYKDMKSWAKVYHS